MLCGLKDSVVNNWREHLLYLVRVKSTGSSRASDKQQVRISAKIDIASIEAVETRNHNHQPLMHATLEELASDIVPLVQPVIEPPHLLQLPIGHFHLDCTRKFLQRFLHVVRKQQNCLWRLSESAKQLVNILE